MLMVREGKSLVEGQRVKVYRNLNKPEYFSICDLKTGIVVAYAKSVVLSGIEKFHVSEKARQRVLKDKRRNVHAWVVGCFSGTTLPDPDMKIAYYNPYRTSNFVDLVTNDVVSSAQRVICHDKYAYYDKDHSLLT
ncbi:hypothetical protein [Paenibacillus sp. GXUN7292]|uniref:hypothetical protein n=1 Tax=Paenibacillus sp. GXUN7292 TaxID=3422499 RepID=UPI003D7E684E